MTVSNHSARGRVGADILGSQGEKPGRANLFSNLTRNLSQETIVICDSLNYIKGFRYQMYCAARESSARVCTVSLPHPSRMEKGKELS
jgi:tRNA uridine 5-carbamoylmethylation protein Kti12